MLRITFIPMLHGICPLKLPNFLPVYGIQTCVNLWDFFWEAKNIVVQKTYNFVFHLSRVLLRHQLHGHNRLVFAVDVSTTVMFRKKPPSTPFPCVPYDLRMGKSAWMVGTKTADQTYRPICVYQRAHAIRIIGVWRVPSNAAEGKRKHPICFEGAWKDA